MMMRAAAATLCALTLVCASTACGSDHSPSAGTPTTSPESPRGEIVSTTPVAQLTTEQTAAYLAQGKFDTPVRNGVDAYRAVYRTIDANGAPTTASGLIILPRSDSHRLRVVTYEHGTLVLKTDAPSVNGQTRPDRARTMMFAAAGYAAIAPDYLGLGEGPGPHPYTHAPSEVTATIDLLRAAKTFVAQQHREFESDILVTGFSQGGHAATAVAKALRGGGAPGFGLAALAPISGPYDVRNAETPAGLDGRVGSRNAVFYFGYWITEMNRIYHLYDNPADAFQQPYAGQVAQLFDGTHDESAIAAALPDRPDLLLTPQFIHLALNPEGAVLKAMTDSDGTCDWTPTVPVHLFAATGDRNVAYANAEHCLQGLHSDKATLTDLGNIDHTATVHTALPQVLALFQQEAPAS